MTQKLIRSVISFILVMTVTSTVTLVSGCEKDKTFDSYIYSESDALKLNNIKLDTDVDIELPKAYCYSFVHSKMMSDSGGVYTNYLESQTMLDHATGHEILSESIGLLMLYAIKEEDKTLFDTQFNLAVKSLLLPDYLVKWRIRENDLNISQSSASIDDLRILRALVLAHAKWEEKRYSALAQKMSKDVLKYSQYESNLVNYYNQEIDEIGRTVDLSYIDLRTMALLSNSEKQWDELAGNGLVIIKNGVISDAFPMYHRTYDFVKETYIKVDVINILDSMTTMLHLSEVGELNQASVDWIYNEFRENGKIYSAYSSTGEPLSNNESTAAYAIIARFAKTAGDMVLYNTAIERMQLFQIQETSSPLFGAFGDNKTLQVFSYDNLQALLAY